MNTAEIGVEKKIREADCNLYGSIDTGKYKYGTEVYFREHISDSFIERYQHLAAKDECLRQSINAYTVWNVPNACPSVRWEYIAEQSHAIDIRYAIKPKYRRLEGVCQRLTYYWNLIHGGSGMW